MLDTLFDYYCIYCFSDDELRRLRQEIKELKREEKEPSAEAQEKMKQNVHRHEISLLQKSLGEKG